MGNAMLPNFMKKALRIKEIILEEDQVTTPLYMGELEGGGGGEGMMLQQNTLGDQQNTLTCK